MIKEILEWTYCIIIAVALALLVRYYIGTPTIVQQHSMYPTLKPDERLILNRWARTTGATYERGDIITFEARSERITETANLEIRVEKYKTSHKDFSKNSHITY